jgi:hypothetical protein
VKYRAPVIFLCAALVAWSQTHGGGFEGPGRYVVVNVESRKALELDRVDHRGVILSSLRQNDSQRWDVERAGPELFYIRNAEDGRALDSSSLDGIANCVRFDGGVNQQWRLEPGKENSIVIVAHDGRALEIPTEGVSGGRVKIGEKTGGAEQRFSMRRIARQR